MENDIFLSIIIPVYNAENTILSCVKSIQEQIVGERCELICVDDGSTDSSCELLDSMAHCYNNMKIIHQNNRGVSFARNRGGREAKGKWITFVDSDDCFEQNSFKEALHIAENNDDCDFIVFDYYEKKTNDGEKISSGAFLYDAMCQDPAKYLEELLCNGKMLTIHSLVNKFYKRELFQKLQLNEAITLGEDAVFNYQYLLQVKKVCTSHISYYIYNNYGGVSLSRGKSLSVVWEAYKEIMGYMKMTLLEYSIGEMYDSIYLKYCLGTVSQFIRTKMLTDEDKCVLRNVLKNMKDIKIERQNKSRFYGILIWFVQQGMVEVAVWLCCIKNKITGS